MKLIVLLVGLAIGFGGGIYWGVHHPQQAQQLSAQEEEQFLKAQMAATQAAKEKLDQLMAKYGKGSGSAPGSGFLGSGSGSGPSLAADPDAQSLRDQQQKQLDQLQQRLNNLSKK